SGSASRTMKPGFGWTLLSRDALRRAETQLREDVEGVRDETGFLSLHQAYADRFFPGTSVLHTRLRYVLFVPWMYQAATRRADLLRQRCTGCPVLDTLRAAAEAQCANGSAGNPWSGSPTGPAVSCIFFAAAAASSLRFNTRSDRISPSYAILRCSRMATRLG